jgi:hypothetical protein
MDDRRDGDEPGENVENEECIVKNEECDLSVKESINTLYIADMDTMLIELTNQKATGVLHELEELNLIRIVRVNVAPVREKLSGKYRGMLTRREGVQLKDHINQMRDEWNSI